MYLLIWIISGIIAGWLTGLVMRGYGFGLIGDLVVGLIGGIIGGWVAGMLGIVTTGWIGHILVAAGGGIILVAIVRAFRRV